MAIESAIDLGELVKTGVVVLGAALGFVALFRKLGLGAVLGYLTAGMLLGPDVLGVVEEPATMLAITDLGIVLLLFLVGLELSPSRLLRLKQDIFGLGLLQVVVSGLVLAAFVYVVTGLSWAAAIVIGLPLALSSTAQVLPALRSSGDINTREGERTFSILLLQDLALVPMLIITAALSRAQPDPSAPQGIMLVVYAIGAIIGLVIAGRFILRPLFQLVGRISERELFIVAGLFTVLAASAIMQSLYLSMALGAFIAGVMLADTPYRHELEADIDPFRSILLGLFFIAVGMMLDLNAIAERPLFVIGMAAGLILLKATVLFGLARAFGVEKRKAVKLGLLLSQGGEFGFVLFASAQSALLIDPAAASLFGAVVTLSMATTPFLMMLNERLDRNHDGRARPDLDGPDKARGAKIIVVGYGRFGQTVGQMLSAKGYEVTLIDSKPAQIEVTATFGAKVYYGDGTRVDLLRLAGAEEAQVIAFCIDGVVPARKMEPILEAFPQAAVFVRAFDRRHLMELDGLDLAGTVREVYESAVCMGKLALEKLGLEEAHIAEIEREYRERDTTRLRAQTAANDLYAMQDLIFKPSRPLAPDQEVG